ncbi:MAG: c-type cytochrome [Rhodanobacteraceae bacterium]
MSRSLLWLMLAVACSAVAQRPAQLGLCAACHGENGIALAPGTPNLGGQDATYLVAAIEQYRSGKRDNSAMRAVVGALSRADIAALAEWYAAQPGCEARAR